MLHQGYTQGAESRVISVQGNANVSFLKGGCMALGTGEGGVSTHEGKEGFYVRVQKLQTERRWLV